MPICAQPTTPRLPCRPVRAGALTSRSTTAEPGCAVQANLCPAYLPGPVAPCDAMPRHETHAVTASPGLAMICRAVPLRPCLPRCAIYAAPRDNRPALPRHDQPRPEAPCADCLAPRCAALANPAWTAQPSFAWLPERCPDGPAWPRLTAPCHAVPWRPRLAVPSRASLRQARRRHAMPRRHCRAMPSNAVLPKSSHAFRPSLAYPCHDQPRLPASPGNARTNLALPRPAFRPRLARPSPPGRCLDSYAILAMPGLATPSPAVP